MRCKHYQLDCTDVSSDEWVSPKEQLGRSVAGEGSDVRREPSQEESQGFELNTCFPAEVNFAFRMTRPE
jgi:hypothetical protein